MTISRIYHSDRIVAVIRCSDEVSHHSTLLSSFTTTPVFQCQVVQKSSIPTELQRKHSEDSPVTHSACCPGRALRWRISGRKREKRWEKLEEQANDRSRVIFFIDHAIYE